MTPVRRFTKKTLPAALANFLEWPEIDVTSLESAELSRFTRLRRAIEAYLDGDRMSPLLKELGLTHEELLRALNRAVTRHEDGRLWGWRGLLQWVRVRAYKRTLPVRSHKFSNGAGLAGALQFCLDEHPEIRKQLDEFLLTRGSKHGFKLSKITHQEAHSKFLEVCEASGIPAHHWPFATETMGKGAIRDYVEQFFQTHHDQVVRAQFGTKAATKSRTGKGVASRLAAFLPYDVVEVDEYRADFLGSIGLETPSGTQWVPISRVIIIAVVDKRNGVVLGYEAIFGRDANKDDFLRALHNALRDWKPRTFSLQGLQYKDDEGFPCRFSDSLARCGWCVMAVDNALAHLADEVIDRVQKIVGCDINYGPPDRPERRPVGEQVFNRLAEIGFRRISSTTGSHPMDPLRQDAEENACAMKFNERAVLDFIEKVIAEYNAQPTIRAHGHSGLQHMVGLVADDTFGFLPPKLPALPPWVPSLNTSIQRARITGNQAKGERPHLNFENAVYRSPDLAGAWHLVGEWVAVHYDVQDMRTVDLYTDKGAFICTARATGAWANEPHTLRLRSQIVKLTRHNKILRAKGESLIQAFLRQMKEDARRKGKGGKAVTKEATALAEHARTSDEARLLEDVSQADDSTVPSTHRAGREREAETAAKWRYDGPPIVLPKGVRARG